MSHMIIKRIKLNKDGSLKIKWAVNNVIPLDWVEDTIKPEWINEQGYKINALDWLAEGIRTEFELRKGIAHSKLGRACLKLDEQRPLWREETHPKIYNSTGKLVSLDYDSYFVTRDHPLVKAGEVYDKERSNELNELDKCRFASLLRDFIKEEENA